VQNLVEIGQFKIKTGYGVREWLSRALMTVGFKKKIDCSKSIQITLSRRFCKKRCRECFLTIGISDDPVRSLRLEVCGWIPDPFDNFILGTDNFCSVCDPQPLHLLIQQLCQSFIVIIYSPHLLRFSTYLIVIQDVFS
jgi:hypothetical protein